MLPAKQIVDEMVQGAVSIMRAQVRAGPWQGTFTSSNGPFPGSKSQFDGVAGMSPFSWGFGMLYAGCVKGHSRLLWCGRALSVVLGRFLSLCI